MTFGQTVATPPLPGSPLDVRVEIKLNNAWTDVSPYVWMDSTSIQRGHPDESTTASPSMLAGVLNNADGRFSQTYPSGPYYPYLGLNTPIRVSIPDASTHLRLELDSASGAKCPNAGALQVWSHETWLDADLDNWYTPQVLAAKWVSSGGQRTWLFQTTAGGFLQWTGSLDGTASNVLLATSTAPVPFVHGRMSVRVAYNKTAGTVTFYTGAQVSGWTQLGASVAIAASGVFAATSPVEIGVCAGNTDSVLPGANGKVYSFAYIPGIGAGVNVALAAEDFTAMTAGTTSWTDGAGNPWTLEGTGYLDNRNYRFHGQVAAWPQSWTPGAANALVNVSASGKLRQLTQGEPPSFTPMYRYFMNSAAPVLAAYWPMEDGSGVTALSPAVGSFPMAWSGSPSISSSAVFPGSASIPVLNSATFTGKVAYAGSWTANDVKLLLNIPASDTGQVNGALAATIVTNGTAATIQLGVLNGGQLILSAVNSAGAYIVGGPGVLGAGLSLTTTGNGVPLAAQVALTASGGTVTVTLTLLTAAGVLETTSTSFAGSIGAVQKVILNSPINTGPLTTTSVGHVAVSPVYTPLASMASSGFNPMAGWASEPAGTRFARVTVEEGLLFRGMGNQADTTAMGVQATDTAENILQACADIDRGMWFEPRPVYGFGYRTRVSLGNQTAALVLDYGQDHLADTLEPTHDDQTVHNDVTVTSDISSASRRAILNDGSAMAIGILGRYATSLDVSPASDNQLADIAGWNLHIGTVNEPRYTAINVDLANKALTSLYYAILNVDAGDRVQIVNPPIWVPPGMIDQLAQGFFEVLSVKDLTEAWTGIPASPWNVMYFDDAVYGRWDTDGSTLTGTLPGTSGTTLTVATTTANSPLWTTSAGDFPFDILVFGERMTVTNITGSTSPQTFTVTRSVNGVVIAPPTGSDVRLFIPPIFSM